MLSGEMMILSVNFHSSMLYQKVNHTSSWYKFPYILEEFDQILNPVASLKLCLIPCAS